MNQSFPSGPLPLGDLWPLTLACLALLPLVYLLALAVNAGALGWLWDRVRRLFGREED